MSFSRALGAPASPAGEAEAAGGFVGAGEEDTEGPGDALCPATAAAAAAAVSARPHSMASSVLSHRILSVRVPAWRMNVSPDLDSRRLALPAADLELPAPPSSTPDLHSASSDV
mmetsp:Transcript_4310/g.12826  ORF Transcript_4310/g.12826 Transcript_4310/m.12826 type:complete len:114 (+) Transcript_4310:632-973(+)